MGDKVIHVGLYSGLGATLAWGRIWSPRPPSGFVMILVGFAYGVLDEFHQMFVAERVASIADLGADLAGVVLGYTLFTFLMNSLNRRHVSTATGSDLRTAEVAAESIDRRDGVDG